MNIAIIPARGGSKRIPHKNIKSFGGRPMMAWAIEAAQSSNLFAKIIVSTDDQEVAEVAIKCGAEVPFVRPDHLSDDYTGTTEVVAHALEWAVSNSINVSAACCVYATAAFIQPEDLKQSLSQLTAGQWSYVFSATEFESPIFRSFSQKTEGGISMFFPEHYLTRSQDLPKAFHDAGQFYWGTTTAWLKKERIFGDNSEFFFIPRWRVQDIDTLDDWKRAELIHHLLRNKQ